MQKHQRILNELNLIDFRIYFQFWIICLKIQHPIKFEYLKIEIMRYLNYELQGNLYYDLQNIWPELEKEVKELEAKVKSEPRELLKSDMLELQLKELPSLLSEDLLEEEVSRESHHSSMMIPDKFLKDSSKVLSEMPSHTPSMPEEKLSLLWMLSMLLRDKAEPSMVSEVDLHHQLSFLLLFLLYYSFHHQYQMFRSKAIYKNH